jgi:hypothetical protein
MEHIEDPYSPASGISASLQQDCRESSKCKEVDYCNALAPLNPFGCAKRNLTGQAVHFHSMTRVT